MPALVEADDDGLYVVKLRGAAQGTPMLVAEVIAAGLARAVDLPVPEVVAVVLDPVLGRNERDSEVRELLLKSGGINVGLDFLPGSITYDPVADPAPSPQLASTIALFDVLVMNPDRSAKNPNMLSWQNRLWLIDHGAALYFHYAWQPETPLAGADRPFAPLASHVLLALATDIEGLVETLAPCWFHAIDTVIAEVPESLWEEGNVNTMPPRDAYARWLRARVEALPAIAAHAQTLVARLHGAA